MAFHSSSSLDAAFNTVRGAAKSATVAESGQDSYTAPCIPKYGIEILEENSGLRDRTTTLEFRKADLLTPTNGLARGATVTIGTNVFTIQQLIVETTYTYIYQSSQ